MRQWQKFLIPDELNAALAQESQARKEAEQKQAEAEAKSQKIEAKLAQYREKFGDLP